MAIYGYDENGALVSVRDTGVPGARETLLAPPQVEASSGLRPHFRDGGWVLLDAAAGAARNLQPTPPEFMATAFTFQERIAIRSARASDPAVDDFMTLIEDPRLTYVDLTLPGTRDAINYLASADVGLLTQERADQVLAGLPAPVPEMPA